METALETRFLKRKPPAPIDGVSDATEALEALRVYIAVVRFRT
jgi:hypothetical protein